MKKTLTAGLAVLTLVGTIFAAPSVATAAVGDVHTSPLFTSTPSGTAADPSWTAPTGIGTPGAMGADDWGRSTIGTITEQALTQSQVQHWESPPTPFVYTPDAQRLGTFTAHLGGDNGEGENWRQPVATPRDAWGFGGSQTSNPVAQYRHRILAPQPAITLDLASQFPELGLSGFYFAGADGVTGWLSSSTKDCGFFTGAGSPPVNCAAMAGPDFTDAGNSGEVFRARGTATGVELDLTAGDWGRGGAYRATVVGFTASGLQVPIAVELAVAAFGGAPTVGALTYSTPVNVPVVIPEADLTAAVGWRTSVERSVSVQGLPASVTPVADGYSFVSAVPTTEAFGFKGTERQAPAGIVESPTGTVTVMALAAEAPEVIVAPTVRDYSFAEPLAAGIPVDVDVTALTEGATFDPTDWTLEAADVLPWSAQGGILTLTPQGDREAFATTVRWRSLIDPTVTSNWATVTAPAAEVVEPPVVVPPVVTPPVVTPPVVTPPAVEPPAVTPTPADPANPTPPSVVKTGVEASPLGFLMGLLAVILAAGSLPLYRRFARR